MVSGKSLQAPSVRSNGIWAICFFAAACMVLVISCGGGGGGGGSSAPSIMFTVSDADSVTLAKVTGTRIQAHNVDTINQEVYSGTATLTSDNTFTIEFRLYPGVGSVLFSATGSIDESGDFVTATVTEGASSYDITLDRTESSTAGGYYGTYSGDSSGIFVAGIDGDGNVMGFDGNVNDDSSWGSFITTLDGIDHFSTNQTNGTVVSGSVSGTSASGIWSNSLAGQDGIFSGPKRF